LTLVYFTRFCAKNKLQIPQSLFNVLNLRDFDEETFQELSNKDGDDGGFEDYDSDDED
jgi:hypothetical protein